MPSSETDEASKSRLERQRLRALPLGCSRPPSTGSLRRRRKVTTGAARPPETARPPSGSMYALSQSKTMYSSLSTNFNPNKSAELPQHPSDTPSCIAWSPNQNPNLLAASAWDKTVRVWEIQAGATGHPGGVPRALFTHDAPVLSCAINSDNALFAGGCDHVVKMHNLQTQQSQVLGQHDAPICKVSYIEEKRVLVTGSWDKTIRCWDGREPRPVMTFTLPGKVYAMDVKFPAAAVVCADRNVHIYDMQASSTAPAMTLPICPLRMQPRALSLFPDRRGYIVGSIEGRCAVQHLQDEGKKKNFAFKCHRVDDARGDCRIFAVNAIDFHRQFGTFITAGSDGTLAIWDKDNKHQLKKFESCNCPVTDCKFDPTGQFIAYSIGYDWHKGYSFAMPTRSPNSILVHRIGAEARKR
eukprot:Polyplicarium_translucidae@DN2721_c1_g1_i1.p2